MWIRTQTGQMIINTDHISRIFVNISQPDITAVCNSISGDNGQCITLGSYKDKKTCIKLLGVLIKLISHKAVINYIDMPSIDEVTDEWLDECEKISKNISF